MPVRLAWNMDAQAPPLDAPAAVRRALDTLPNAPSTDTTSRYGVAMALRRFVADHPAIEVFLGHQSRIGQPEAETR